MTSDASAPGAPSRRVWAAALLVFLTVAVYSPVVDNGYVWDDDDYVYANPTLTSLDGLGRIWLERGAIPQYYPLVHTTFWIEYRLWGLSPLGFHVVNVLLHAFGALLLWRVLAALGIAGVRDTARKTGGWGCCNVVGAMVSFSI